MRNEDYFVPSTKILLFDDVYPRKYLQDTSDGVPAIRWRHHYTTIRFAEVLLGG